MKKVALFVCHDLVGLLMLNGVVREMKDLGLIPVIYNTATHKNRKFKVLSPPLVSAFNVQVLENVVLPFLEKGDAGKLTYKQLAQAYGGEYCEVQDINAPEVIQKIANDPDIIGGISIRFLQVFERSTINAIKRKGFLWNLHSGLLPDYKGLLLPYRAIENGEKEYGVSLHETAAGIDEGGIIGKGAMPLKKAKPVMELYMDTVDTAVGIVVDALGAVRKGLPLEAAPQSSIGKYYSNPTAQEFVSFVQKGIFYADPLTTVQRISDAFTIGGQESEELKTAIKAFFSINDDMCRRTFINEKIA